MEIENGRILIIGAYGFGNMGDEAILQGILEEMNNKENIDVVSATPRETEALHGVRAVLVKNIDYTKYSTVVFGGGGYSPGSYEPVMKIWLRLKERGARLIVKVVGPSPEIAGKEDFGPDELGIEQKIILSEILENADYFSVRTYKDLERVKMYTNVDKEIKVETDPAYNISFSKEKGRELLKRFGFSTQDKLCGVSVAKFGYREGVKNFIENYKRDFTLVPIPMCRHYYAGFENDVILLREYFKQLKLLSNNTTKWMKYPFTPSELKSVLSNLTYLITARKHAMVLALGSGLSPQQILLLGTRESGMAEYFNVEEIDWRQWPQSPDGLGFAFAKKLIDIKGYIVFIQQREISHFVRQLRSVVSSKPF